MYFKHVTLSLLYAHLRLHLFDEKDSIIII